jgi:hypothetical protein
VHSIRISNYYGKNSITKFADYSCFVCEIEGECSDWLEIELYHKFVNHCSEFISDYMQNKFED